MHCKTIVVVMLIVLFACKNSNSQKPGPIPVISRDNNENPYPEIAAIPLPGGYKRLDASKNSFPGWLRDIPLKKGKAVYLYDGSLKNNQTAQFAVLNIPVGHKDLQQCADAVMRLRATYFYEQEQFDSIAFYDNEGKCYRLSAPYNRINFNNYLQRVFGMCGSASLSKQLHLVEMKTIMPGDVLIRGGFPGHAAMVMDVATNDAGEKIYLLAQSYMPAQDIHLLKNPSNLDLSPWYHVNEEELIHTPEYIFRKDELKRW